MSLVFPPPPPARGAKLPDREGMKKLRVDWGWTYRDIAEEYGVTEEAVRLRLDRYGLVKQRVDYGDLIPWKIRPEHQNNNQLAWLRLAAREKLGVEYAELSPRRQRDFEAWKRKLDRLDAVIHYGQGETAKGEVGFGFFLVKRRPGIDDWLIRKPAWLVERAC